MIEVMRFFNLGKGSASFDRSSVIRSAPSRIVADKPVLAGQGQARQQTIQNRAAAKQISKANSDDTEWKDF